MELAELGHAAMADRYRVGVEIEGSEAVDTADGLLYTSLSDFPVLMNGAIPLGGDSRALLEDARGFFAERNRGFSFFARDEAENAAAVDAGLHAVIDRYPAMVARGRFAERDVGGIELRRVADAAHARDYSAVADAAFPALGLPAGLLADLPLESFVRDDAAGFVAYDGGRPVACASVMVARRVAGIQWVAVLEEARGRGLADLCTRGAANAGFDIGADYAWLEASHMGEPVYRRMGFEEVFSYRIYAGPPPPGA